MVWFSILLAIGLLVATFFVFNGSNTEMEYTDYHTEFNEGWTLEVNGKTEKDVKLPVHVVTGKNEAALLSCTLPDEIEENAAIISRNYHQIMEVRIDGNLVFSYPNPDWNGYGNVISDEWSLIKLKPEDAGKTIEFSYINTTVFKFKAYIGNFYYGKDNSLVQFVRSEGFVEYIMAIIVIVIACLLLMVSFIYRKHTNQAQNTAMGVALFCFGFWFANRARMGLFPEHSLFVYYAATVALVLIAPFVFLYSYYRNSAFRKIALYGFYLCILADIFLMVSSTFIKYNIEIIAMFAYGLSVLGLSLNTYSLFIGGFGKNNRDKRPIDVRLDRTEFFANLLFPLFGLFETVFFSHRLWTEASMVLRFALLAYAIIYMIFVLWRTFLVVQDRTIVTKKLHDSQLELMMGQIQPHFIFNTLSSIRTLVMVDPTLSYSMLYDFSNYLRANIDNVTNLGGINFAAEVEHIKSYVNIEKVRFGERLEMEYDIQVEDFTVPPLSIQPLVENAIKHGVCKKMEGGTVYLKSYSTTEFNVVEVVDDGVGFNQNTALKVFGALEEGSNSSRARTNDVDDIDINSVRDVIKSLTLLDNEGNALSLKDSSDMVEHVDLTGNGSERHQSAGMMNILLRLKELSSAKVEIYSRDGHGTDIKVYFPKEEITAE